jgi:hypothetical protein
MGENEGIYKAPTSTLEQILDKTFKKLDTGEDFNSELLLELRKLASDGSFPR